MSLPGRLLGALVLSCVLAVVCPLAAARAGGRDGAVPHAPPGDAPANTLYSATLEQCISSADPMQRSVTFTGQMTAVSGTQRMGMRIELQERAPSDASFHTVTAPGLGMWRGSEAGVKIYRYVKQITNLSAPAVYRAVVHFHWLGQKGHLLKRSVLRTASCAQSRVPAPGPEAGTQQPAVS